MADFDFDKEHKVMKMYVDNAKNYIHLSGAAIALSVAFVRQIVGVGESSPIIPETWLISSWLAFLLAIVSGAFYQYLAAKYMEIHLSSPHTFAGLDWLAREPGRVYGVMLIGFYVGAGTFVIGAISKIP